MKYLIALLFFIPLNAIPEEITYPEVQPIVEAILKLEPTLNESKANVIATAIQYCAVDKSINWRTLVSLAYVESRFDPKVVRKVNGKSIDFGLFQVNVLNIKRYKLDKKKLNNPVYNTKAACQIIEDIRKIKKNWVEYYNTGAGSRDTQKKRDYGIKVAAALEKLL